MASFFKKLFGKKKDQEETKSTITFKRAKKGTYDESYFIDPKTSKFQFPKYRHNKNCLIKVKDCTDYKLYDLDPEEMRYFSIGDFELRFFTPDIEIEPFWELFNKATSDHLKPYTFLKSKGEELRDLVEEIKMMIEENESFILADSELKQKLYDSSCFNKYEFKDENEAVDFKVYAFDFLKANELKLICKAHNLKSSLSKQELINQLIENNISIDLPIPVLPNDKFHEMMRNFYSIYINDIKKNIERWHPLYIKEVWNSVLSYAENEEIEKMAKEILNSKYWEEYLYDESI